MLVNYSEAVSLEQELEKKAWLRVWSAVSLLPVLLSLLTNVFVALAPTKNPQLRNPAGALLVFDAAANMILALGIILETATTVTGVFSISLTNCMLLTLPKLFGVFCGSAALFILGLERYWAICHSVSYVKKSGRQNAVVMCSCATLLSAGQIIVRVIIYMSRDTDGLYLLPCEAIAVVRSPVIVAISSINPIMTFLCFPIYLRAFYELWKKTRIVEAEQPRSGAFGENLQKRRLMGSLLLILFVGVFSRLLSFGSSAALKLAVRWEDPVEMGVAMRGLANVSVSLSLGSNFFIFYWRSPDWRASFRQILGMKPRSSVVTSGSMTRRTEQRPRPRPGY